MVEYPLATLIEAGITDIIIVTGGRKPGEFLELLGNGHKFGAKRLYYTYQEGNGGIADALKLAEPFMAEDEDAVVILGDNYFEDGITGCIQQWQEHKCNWWSRNKGLPPGAFMIVKEVPDPTRFGIAEIAPDGSVLSIEEKPAEPKSNLAILGCYMLDSAVWPWLHELEPSARGELEITDILRRYMNTGALSFANYSGYWSDLGTHSSLMSVASRLMEKANVRD